MLQAGVSWLVAVLPLLDMDAEPGEISRTGNAHRRFVPTNVYPTSDGFIYIALGSNIQWQRLVALPRFAPLASRTEWMTAEGRYRDREEMYRSIGAITAAATQAEIEADFAAAKIPHTKINTISTSAELEAVRTKLNRTTLPDGRAVRLPPAAVDVSDLPRAFAPPPRYGEHTRAVLGEIGLSKAEIDRLIAAGVAAG
jgi:crotonobetainyl-CoA:carnitine CoA-transferase CaiB-like acyl-CoA transferase